VRGASQRPPAPTAGVPAARMRRGPRACAALKARAAARPAALGVQPPSWRAALPFITIFPRSAVPSMRTAPEQGTASVLAIGGPVVLAGSWVLRGRRRRSGRLRWADTLTSGIAAVWLRLGAGAPPVLLCGSPCLTWSPTPPAGTVAGVREDRCHGIPLLLGVTPRQARKPPSRGGGVVELPRPPTATAPCGPHHRPRPGAWGRLPAQPVGNGPQPIREGGGEEPPAARAGGAR
jgi:hypothetical protein